MKFKIQDVQRKLDAAFEKNSEVDLLALLKENSFLFFNLYDRKFGIQPNFAEVKFGTELRCDFCWLNDNSDGPEWVLVEIEKPQMKLFTKKREPSFELNHALEQVKFWKRYFRNNPTEKNRIFGAVGRFRYILVAGTREDWSEDHAAEWRVDHNDTSEIEVRSTTVFYEALEMYAKYPDGFWSFEENPKSCRAKNLKNYWSQYEYINQWRSKLA